MVWFLLLHYQYYCVNYEVLKYLGEEVNEVQGNNIRYKEQVLVTINSNGPVTYYSLQTVRPFRSRIEFVHKKGYLYSGSLSSVDYNKWKTVSHYGMIPGRNYKR